MDMPLLDFVKRLFPNVNLEKTIIIACQHLLETNYTMFEYFFKMGLKPENTFLLGKCYSTNKDVLRKFQERGVFVHKGSVKYDSYRSFDSQFEEQIIDFLNLFKKMDLTKYEKVIILDDGGYLIYAANTMLKNLINVVGVEQTSSGYLKLNNLKLNFPVINVARSEAKLELESPLIAEVSIQKLKEKLLKLELNPRKVLVVGKGFIGANISKILIKEGFEVRHYDLKKQLSDFKQAKISSILSQFDMVIGCTGEPIIGKEQFNLLKRGTILVSASSSDREFSASNLRKLVERNRNCHKDLKINGLILMNSGFPINFDGKPNSVSPNKIQLTRALMFSAACLATIKNYLPILLDLDKNIQKKISLEFQKTIKTPG